ncbi:MAG: outer membrane beta-barrel protein [Flavobacteriales bacterium]|nr:outer membrane beta-barrel protein [Flavobacteriales bacterium]
MIVKKLVFVTGLIGAMLFSSQADAQQRIRKSGLDFGFMLGGDNYTGDLTNKYFESKGIHANYGLLVRYTPVQRFTFRVGANYGKISGYDSWYGNDENRAFRNLHFESDLWDFHGAFEINLNTLEPKAERGVVPYVMGGISVFKFNPRAQFFYEPTSWQNLPNDNSYETLADRDGDWVELQPLSTEGQETTEYNDLKRYSLTQFAIPVGLGVKFKLTQSWTFGLEYSTRITFTDYLDDVSGDYKELVFLESSFGAMSKAMSDRSPSQNPAFSARGDNSKIDMYNIFGITLTYRLMKSDDVCPAFR